MMKIIALFAMATLLSCQGEKLTPKAIKKPIVPVVQAVASLEELKPEARVKIGDSEWRTAVRGQKFRNQDQLKTAANGNARIDFVSGKTSLRVSENSLVVVWDREENKNRIHVVGFPHGQIDGTLKDENDYLEIRTPSGWIKVKHKSQVKVLSKPSSNAVDVSVLQGDADVVTATGTTQVKEGKTVKLVSVKKESGLIDYLTSIPIETAIQKEKVFKITTPSLKEFRSKESKIIFRGIWEGDFSVWANGKTLNADDDGTFTQTFELHPGLNIINIQVSDPARKNVDYYIYKITRD